MAFSSHRRGDKEKEITVDVEEEIEEDVSCVDNCGDCGEALSLFNRKEACKACRKPICSSCSRSSGVGRGKVCLACYLSSSGAGPKKGEPTSTNTTSAPASKAVSQWHKPEVRPVSTDTLPAVDTIAPPMGVVGSGSSEDGGGSGSFLNVGRQRTGNRKWKTRYNATPHKQKRNFDIFEGARTEGDGTLNASTSNAQSDQPNPVAPTAQSHASTKPLPPINHQPIPTSASAEGAAASSTRSEDRPPVPSRTGGRQRGRTRQRRSMLRSVHVNIASLSLREKCLNEILETERDFNRDLEIILLVFLDPLRSEGVLNEEDLTVIFCNLEGIAEANKGLMAAFEEMPDDVGLAFMEADTLMDLYAVYCRNMEAALALVEKREQENKKFNSFLQYCMFRPECRNLNLSAFLVKPFQRITKYPLLLKELCRHTDPEDPDLVNLELALNTMHGIVLSINDRKREVDELLKRQADAKRQKKEKTHKMKRRGRKVGEKLKKWSKEGAKKIDTAAVTSGISIGATPIQDDFNQHFQQALDGVYLTNNPGASSASSSSSPSSLSSSSSPASPITTSSSPTPARSASSPSSASTRNSSSNLASSSPLPSSPAMAAAAVGADGASSNFRKVADSSGGAVSQSEVLVRWSTLCKVCRDFDFTVKTWAKTIISEVHLPADQKTIKPSKGYDGWGQSKCEKYVVNSVCFAFPDYFHMFEGWGNEAVYNKMAGHELKSLNHWLFAGGRDINFPIMAIVDYRGFRLVCYTQIPVTKNTIKLGSNDLGETVHATNEGLNNKVETIAQKLRLKPHAINISSIDSKAKQALLYSPTLLQGHQGLDGRFYLLNFSGTFPPVEPNPQLRMGSLFERFRPEFLKEYDAGLLCPDAYTQHLNESEYEEVCEAIQHATSHLVARKVPECASFLSSIDVSLLQDKILNFRRLKLHLHRYGINMRYAGYVRQHIYSEQPDNWAANLLLIEVIARVLQYEMDIRMRAAAKLANETGCLAHEMTLVSFLNLIFGNKAESTLYWDHQLRAKVDNKYYCALTQAELDFDYSLKSSICKMNVLGDNATCSVEEVDYTSSSNGLALVLRRLLELVSMEVNISASLFGRDKSPFDVVDIKQFEPHVKHLSVVIDSMAFDLKARALARAGRVSAEETNELYRQSLEKFEEALEAAPLHTLALVNAADLLFALGSKTQAKSYLDNALKADPTAAKRALLHTSFLDPATYSKKKPT